MVEITGSDFFEKLKDSVRNNSFYNFLIKEQDNRKYIILKKDKEEFITTFYQRYIDDIEDIIKISKTDKEITEKILQQ